MKQKGFAYILVILAGVVVAATVAMLFLKSNQLQNLDENNLPKFVQADWIDLSRIGDISKFRSAVGHDYTHGTYETCRSMKHYFSPDGDNTNDPQKIASLNGSKEPVPPTEPTIDIFSPVDGKIIKIESGADRTPIGDEIRIRPNAAPNYTFELGHIYPRGVSTGMRVKAGEKIGVIGAHQSADMVLRIEGIGVYRLVSYFEVMPDSVFDSYKKRFGVKNQSDFVISKEFRDAHPLKCISGSEEFVGGSSSDPSESVTLPK